MTPYEFLRRYDRQEYDSDPRIVNGQFFSPEPLDVSWGDTVGVVLLNLGGPDGEEAVEPFLYNLFMDPAIVDFSNRVYFTLRGRLRQLFASYIAHFRGQSVAEDYKKISDDGGSPINELTRQQAQALEKELSERYSSSAGVTFNTYVAMRYWHPFSEETAAKMKEDEVDEVVLLPLYPQYSKTTTGASLVYWHELERAGEIPEWPTSFVFEYATHPKYIEALSDRIDDGIRRFPWARRDDVHLLFSAHGTPMKELKVRRDPYCCLVHSTVQRVMEYRGHEHTFSTAFQSKVGRAEWLGPSTADEIVRLVEEGVDDILVVPVAFVSDHIETSYELAIEIPEDLEEEGASLPKYYEVTTGLNDHPTFIGALADVAAGQLDLPNVETPVPWSQRPHIEDTSRELQCQQCERITEAINWSTVHEAEEEGKRSE